MAVADPTIRGSEIVADKGYMVVVFGAPVIVHCHAVGWPRPSVTWWRGDRMLPLSSERYEQFRDYSLLIRRVNFRDLGPYTCQAYNGYGRPSSYTIIVQAIGPVYTTDTLDAEFSRYIVPQPQPDPNTLTTGTPSPRPRPRARTTTTAATTTTTTTIRSQFDDTTVATTVQPVMGNIRNCLGCCRTLHNVSH